MRAVTRKLTTWLCFVVGLSMGVLPAQSLVLCLEPGGGMTLELGSGGECRGCEPESHSADEAAKMARDEAPCGCVDISIVDTVTEFRSKTTSLDLSVAWNVAALPATPPFLACAKRPVGRVLGRPPTLLPALAFIRSTVLLV